MVSHLIEQQCVIIWWSRSNLTIFGSFWRSSQGPHVLFELERFQFFSLYLGSKVCTKEGSFQGVEGKRLKVIQSLFLSLPLCFYITFLFCFLVFESVQFYALCVSLCFCLFVFSFFLILFFIKKKQKNKNSMCLCILVLVYPGWPLKQSFLNFVSFVAQMSISMHN